MKQDQRYIPFKNYANKFKTSFSPHISGLWNSLPKQIQCKNLEDFKMHTKKELKPPKYKHFSSGTKQGNTLLTRIRVGRSFLNEHKFTIGLTDSPECLCHFRTESPQHYFLDCFLYLPERQTLFTLIEHYVPSFSNWTMKKKLDLILRGIHMYDPEFYSLNVTLTKAVQNFILSTNRFASSEIS